MQHLARYVGLPAFFLVYGWMAVGTISTGCADVCDLACDSYADHLEACQPFDIPTDAVLCYDFGDWPDITNRACPSVDAYRASCRQQWDDAAEEMGPLERDWARLDCERTVVWADTWGECEAMEDPVRYLWPSG